nr:phage portal protein [Nocardioides ochotonae]
MREAYYDGKHAVRAVGTIIPPQYYRLGIVLGWSAKAVDILARRCNLDAMVWPDGDLADLGASELWEENRMASEVDQGITASLIYGPAFVINTTGAEGEPDSLIHFKDARNATGEWNARARRLDSLLSVTGRGERDQPTSLALYLDGVTYTAEKRDGTWEWEAAEHPWGVPAEPLTYKPDIATGRPFGRSRISRPVMSLQDQAARTVIRMEAHNDVYTIPDLWMLGADASIFKNADGSQKNAFQIVMGRIKGVPDDPDREGDANARVDVKQFPASSPQPHIMSLKQQAQLFSGETSIPLTSLGVSDMSNPTSADSYIASREDLIAEAEGATDEWSPALRRAFARGLAIKNDLREIPAAWSTIDTKWRSPVYLSRAQQADAGAKQLAAAPEWLKETDVGLELLGLSPQQIKEARRQRQLIDGRSLLERVVARGNGA